MEGNVQKFMELMRYVDYIKEERVKIQSFLGGLPHSYRDKIEFVDTQTLEETIRMVSHCYEQGKGKVESQLAWERKQNKEFEPRRKEFKCSYS